MANDSGEEGRPLVISDEILLDYERTSRRTPENQQTTSAQTRDSEPMEVSTSSRIVPSTQRIILRKRLTEPLVNPSQVKLVRHEHVTVTEGLKKKFRDLIKIMRKTFIMGPFVHDGGVGLITLDDIEENLQTNKYPFLYQLITDFSRLFKKDPNRSGKVSVEIASEEGKVELLLKNDMLNFISAYAYGEMTNMINEIFTEDLKTEAAIQLFEDLKIRFPNLPANQL